MRCRDRQGLLLVLPAGPSYMYSDGSLSIRDVRVLSTQPGNGSTCSPLSSALRQVLNRSYRFGSPCWVPVAEWRGLGVTMSGMVRSIRAYALALARPESQAGRAVCRRCHEPIQYVAVLPIVWSAVSVTALASPISSAPSADPSWGNTGVVTRNP